MYRLLVLALLLLAGCSSTSAPGDPVEVRIANESAVAFDGVRVVFPDREESYGAIPAGGRSDYRSVERAYRYAFVEVHAGAERLVLQPIDYVGEELLRAGRYTYALAIAPDGRNLTLTLRQDP